jgi:hypothetical protein
LFIALNIKTPIIPIFEEKGKAKHYKTKIKVHATALGISAAQLTQEKHCGNSKLLLSFVLSY